ncbi:hypothetical protein FB451DRAFT_1375153 [Mycena latifolia]|nr:hypothetical protein FB451DRAFT_1375153 [Mycena latifolia]
MWRIITESGGFNGGGRLRIHLRASTTTLPCLLWHATATTRPRDTSDGDEFGGSDRRLGGNNTFKHWFRPSSAMSSLLSERFLICARETFPLFAGTFPATAISDIGVASSDNVQRWEYSGRDTFDLFLLDVLQTVIAPKHLSPHVLSEIRKLYMSDGTLELLAVQLWSSSATPPLPFNRLFCAVVGALGDEEHAASAWLADISFGPALRLQELSRQLLNSSDGSDSRALLYNERHKRQRSDASRYQAPPGTFEEELLTKNILDRIQLSQLKDNSDSETGSDTESQDRSLFTFAARLEAHLASQAPATPSPTGSPNVLNSVTNSPVRSPRRRKITPSLDLEEGELEDGEVVEEAVVPAAPKLESGPCASPASSPLHKATTALPPSPSSPKLISGPARGRENQQPSSTSPIRNANSSLLSFSPNNSRRYHPWTSDRRGIPEPVWANKATLNDKDHGEQMASGELASSAPRTQSPFMGSWSSSASGHSCNCASSSARLM